MVGYYDKLSGVCPFVYMSVRPFAPYPIDNLSIHGLFSNFAYIFLSGMRDSGLLMAGFFTESLPLFILANSFWPIIPLLFMISQ